MSKHSSDRHSTNHVVNHPPSDSEAALVHTYYSTMRTSAAPLAKIADCAARQAGKNEIAAGYLRRRQEYDDWMRANSICSECGGKALYYMMGKRYCTKHLAIGKAAHAKKWTPQVKAKR